VKSFLNYALKVLKCSQICEHCRKKSENCMCRRMQPWQPTDLNVAFTFNSSGDDDNE